MSIKTFTLLDWPSDLIPREDTATLSQMPGGEWHSKGSLLNSFEVAVVCGGLPDDLIALLIWADAVKRDDGNTNLIIPYLPGARQDRRNHGEALSAKVYADLINKCGFSKVICLDPHSDVMPALIDNCIIAKLTDVVRMSSINFEEYVGIIAPDAGASKRAALVADNFKLPVFQALKKRDMATGKLSGFKCEPLPSEGKLLVVDDICDGGGTFKGLAKETGLNADRLSLWVTHGIFSKGAEDLWKYYGKIYTTNSHPGKLDAEYNNDFRRIVERVEVIRYLETYL
jgi:ribose-phosphate pyrophosphokinase